jgi:hypothetical protein
LSDEQGRHGTRTVPGWLWPLTTLIAGLGLFSVFLGDPDARSLHEMGAAYLLTSYGQVLPVAGFGLVLASLTRGRTALALVLFGVSIPAGLAAEHWLISNWLIGSSTEQLLTLVSLVPPICCVLPALALLSSESMREWIATIAAPLLGIAIGFAIAFGNPSEGWQFPAGAGVAALWLAVAPRGMLARLRASWLRIGGRIFASWLLAIALLLGSSTLLGQPSKELPLPAAVVPAPEGVPLPTAPEGVPLPTVPPGAEQPRSWLGKPERP